jgi:hypothetical protein
MDKLIKHLISEEYWKLIPSIERNNAIRFIYTCLLSATSDGADKFVLKEDHLEWYKGETIIGHFPSEKIGAPTPSYSSNLHTMMKRDTLLQHYLRITSETSTEMVVRIVSSDEA